MNNQVIFWLTCFAYYGEMSVTFSLKNIKCLIWGTSEERQRVVLVMLLLFAVGGYFFSVLSPWISPAFADNQFLGAALIAIIGTIIKIT